ncbi:sensor histidine kinase [Paenibacillus koleovorans]|uniref:sensor histidine kinase n=1 Tax=Paenibacillus koleovorans TaxID=121608 RepID=UPI001FE32B61|nr:HAMP domain-containing sensor histidine kinase [Paenibacillus koleovorans]
MSIRGKLIVSHVAMIIVPALLLVIAAILAGQFFFNDREATFEAEGKSGANMLQHSEVFAGLSFLLRVNPELLADPTFLRRTDDRLQEEGAAIAVLREGRLLFVSSSLIADQSLADKLMNLPANREHGPGFNKWIESEGTSYFVRSAALNTSGETEGTDGITLYLLENKDRLPRFWLIPLLFLFLLLVIGGTNGVLSYSVSRSIVRPLRELTHAAHQIKEGNLDVEVKRRTGDEIGELSAAFKEMRLRLKQSIAAQLQAEDNRKQMLASISHDLKTPITAVSNCIEALHDGIADTPERQNKYYRMMQQKMHEMNHLIDELFLFSKLDMRKEHFRFERIDIVAYLEDYVEELKHDPRLEGVAITLERESAGPMPVMADHDKLRRVFSNIVDNSLKHMDGGHRRLAFELSMLDSRIRVVVRDNGRGTDPAELPFLFDSFYRADLSRNSTTGGSGLGLSIVRHIIEAHGGVVEAAGAPGEGLAITMTLDQAREAGGV